MNDRTPEQDAVAKNWIEAGKALTTAYDLVPGYLEFKNILDRYQGDDSEEAYYVIDSAWETLVNSTEPTAELRAAHDRYAQANHEFILAGGWKILTDGEIRESF